jgi:hypothetical protein
VAVLSSSAFPFSLVVTFSFSTLRRQIINAVLGVHLIHLHSAARISFRYLPVFCTL